MKLLHTIEEIHKIFETAGSSPLLVTCNDFNDWVCKYDRFPMNLFNELLASEFAKIWEIRTPETAIIKVKEEHIPAQMIPPLQKNLFVKECFGSLYLQDAKEIDLTILPLFNDINFRNKVRDKIDFFYAIDHVNIFNTSSLNNGLYQISEDESILNTDLAKILFSKNTKIITLVNNLVEKFYLCAEECKNKLPEILAKVPTSWNLNLDDIKTKIESIFSDEWLKSSENTFRQFVQSFIILN